ncbi:hypothetical protein NAV28_16715 [Pseudomonas stutzeri]|nr:hypothetical protein [Stutzerimonas degradans]
MAFVLGPLNVMMARQLFGLKVDCMYHFSADEFSLPDFSVSCQRLPDPQLDALKEAVIVESCIDRAIFHVANSGCEALMRRALRLSELRVEARCYLNAIEFLQRELISTGAAIESVIFVSRYLQPTDVFLPKSPIDWHQVLHTGFLGLVPGLSRLVFLWQIFGGQSIKRHGKRVQ